MKKLVLAFSRALLIAAFLAAWAEASHVPNTCNINYPSDAQVEWQCRRIKTGEGLEKLFGESWPDVARFNRIDRRHSYPGTRIKVPKRLEDIKNFNPMPDFFPPAEKEPKFILVDLSEQFLGAYEYGKLVFSSPVATGERGNETPNGEFRITAYHGRHRSSKYFVEGTRRPYPMHYALRFFITKRWVSYWIHGRDIPGYPASHGCIGLYDEEMQKDYYGVPKEPVLMDAKRLSEWAIAPVEDDSKFHDIDGGPKMSVIGRAPAYRLSSHKKPLPPRERRPRRLF
jgi:hypothetical protein